MNTQFGRDCVMVGPGPTAQGGVASVVQVLEAHDLFASGAVCMLPSFSAGGAGRKARVAICAWFRYAGLLCIGRAPVLHVHVSSHGSFWRKAVFIWSARLARRKIVFHLHGGGFRQFYEGTHPFARRLILATMKCSDVLLCLASPVQAWLCSLLPDHEVRWWPNPVPNDLFADRRTALPRSEDILFLGALLPAKGLNDLLHAFTLVHARRPHSRLVLAGEGPMRVALQAQVAEMGLGDHVLFAGWVDATARAEWLSRAALLVLPSHLEAQPMVLLEAMAAAVPFVSTDVGGIPDIVTPAQRELLVKPSHPEQLAAAMLDLMTDEQRCEQLVRSAQAHVEERHRADRVVAAYRSLYLELDTQRV